MKKFLTTALVGGALVGTVATAGVAGATAAPSTGSTPTTVQHPKAHTWIKAHRKELRRAGLDAAAKAIGISPSELRTDLRAGTSVAAVANQHGVSTTTLVNDLVQAADARVNAAVTAGKITQTRASAIEQRLPTVVTRAVNHTFKARTGTGSTTSTTAG
jgi:transposase-like protein